MKIKKIIVYICGGLSASLFPLGIAVAICPDVVSIITGIIFACLSLAFGMLTVNPILFFPLLLGILMIFFKIPCGIILTCFGLGGVIAVPIVARKILKK